MSASADIRFSASDAALEGFQVLHRHWRVVVGWAGFNLLALLADAGHGLQDAGAGPRVLGICLDTGHRHRLGDVAEGIRQGGKAIITLHVHDNHGQRDEHQMPFTGTIEWASVLRALREIGYQDTFMYEVGRDADVSQLPENHRALMALS